MIGNRYKIDDFDKVIYDGFNYNIDPCVTEIIQMLSDQVGDPEYIRTPQFPKQDRQKYKHDINNKRNFSDNQNENQEWERLRQFKATQIVKQDGIDGVVGIIRKHLNKLSEKNYDSVSEKIRTEVTKIVGEETEPSDQIVAECDKLGDAIFTIASSNIFYSEIYARLLKGLMNEFTFMESIVKTNFDNFKNIFSTIEYCSPNKDYDKFCEINKTNEKRRAIGAFYINLAKMEVIEKYEILNIISSLQDYQTQKMNEAEQTHVVDELSEVLFIMITDSKPVLNVCSNDDNQESWDNIINKVEKLSKMKKCDAPSITSKTIFKNMDIWDAIVNSK